MSKAVPLSQIVRSPYFLGFSPEFANAIHLPSSVKTTGVSKSNVKDANTKDGTPMALLMIFLTLLFGVRCHGSYASRTFFGFKH